MGSKGNFRKYSRGVSKLVAEIVWNYFIANIRLIPVRVGLPRLR
jgi:hypothetical protein